METFENPDVRIQDVMSVNPIIIKKGRCVEKAAKLMKEADVGSLLVLSDDGALEGIITEMDIVFKVVAEGLEPDIIKVEEIMSSPVHSIEGNKDLSHAAGVMAELGVRHLPVTKEGNLIGMLTENDIIELSPALLDITREYARIQYPGSIDEYEEPVRREISGYCESCATYSDRLSMNDGQLLCPECYK